MGIFGRLEFHNYTMQTNKQMKFTKKLGIFGRVEIYATKTKTWTKIQTKQAKTRTDNFGGLSPITKRNSTTTKPSK